MFRVFQEEKLITIAMFAFLGSSILLRVFLGLLYRNMIKEADNMASTRNRLLKQCKTKFASCYQLGNGVANIPVFVDKFLNRMALGHLSFETIYHLSGQLMLLSVVFSGIGVCKSIVGGRTVGDVLPFYIVSFFGLYVYFSVSTVVDVRGKKRMLKINLVDYLENHLSPRIEVTRQDMEMLYGEAVFEEKQLPYGRVRGGRKGRSRKGSRGIQAKPEKRRTVELMPIESRMAAGGEQLQREDAAEQIYSVRQQLRPEGVRQMPQAEEGQQNMRISRPDRAQRTEQMPEMGREQRRMPETGREDRMTPETGREQSMAPETGREQSMAPEIGRADRVAQETGGKQSVPPETDREQKMTRVSENEEQWKARSAEEQPAVQMAENRQQPGWPSAENAFWAEQERGTQIQPLFPGGQAAGETPEDSAAVTEEELEALLKEFLTT